MLDWKVAVPSYKRAPKCRDMTLAMLLAGGVKPELITVFVANEDEAKEYRDTLDKGSYGDIVVGRLGMHEIRNCITRHYPDGQRLLQVDDDIPGLYRAVAGKLEPVEHVVDVVNNAFEACAAVGARLWGLYPVCNAFYMKGNPLTTDLRPIIGTFYGNVNDRSHVLKCVVKSDIERTLMYYEQDGKVVRFNNIAPKHRPFASGGHEAAGQRTTKASQEATDYLCKRWPQWVMTKDAFERGHAEVRLKAK